MVLTIDMGSSSVRAFLFDRAGMPLAESESRREHTLRSTPDGGVEANADVLFALVGECIDETLRTALRLGRPVAAVAFTPFLHGLLGLSAAGRPLPPVYFWADPRSARAASATACSNSAFDT